MAGGTFTSHNKVRPGAYINVRTNNLNVTNEGISGIVTIPIVLGFGPEKTVIEVDSGTNFNRIFGYSLDSPQLLLVREALKRAGTVLVYRVNEGTKASAELAEELMVTAKYGGERGNEISVVIQPNVDYADTFNVLTYLGVDLVNTQLSVEGAADLIDNDLVTFSGEGNLSTTAGITLSGGATTDALAGDYADYFNAIAVYDFNTLALPIDDQTTKVAGVNFIKALRDQEGKKCQIVISGYRADHEAVINVKNGVVLEGGTILTPAQAVPWVAGATATAAVNESLTYFTYEGAIDVHPRYTNSEIITSLNNGEFLFTEKRGTAVVEQDINSLVTLTVEKNQEFRKNRVLRVLDDIANNTKQVFEDNFIGRVNNNADGRGLFLANRISYFTALQDLGAIEDFSSDDVSISLGETKDTIVMNAIVKPIDSIEKLYMTVVVQ
ncbi:Phage tail sheath protein [Amphibacillus marinus]|uniref:Phage tail sheath protein n=1 Tax=Amphibacillus marinus TaxID=872970 RepID=A0A1H8IZZ4_9BACI|nr:phage tail sheath family protein [Amphibacillus marinus]SEN73695.1 Phage tail sheath protein [Amphibacillus marinus]